MRIGFINPSVGSISGGSETIIHQFAEQLSARHEVTILTGRSRKNPIQKALLNAPFEVLTVPFWPRFTPANKVASKLVPRLTPYKTESLTFYYNTILRSKIKKRIKEMDVVSTHYRLDSRLFSNLALKLGTPSVFHILGGAYNKDFFDRDKSTMYVATSHDTQRQLRKLQGIDIDDVVTPGIPSWAFSHPQENRAKGKSLLFVGRLQQSKGVFELLDILSQLLDTDRELHLTVVGEGEILPQLKKKASDLKIQNNITFTGSLFNEKLFEYYFSSTLFIFPSKAETFGMVPLEAMACGLPVITSDIPALRESTGGNAVLLPPEQKDSWVDAVQSLLGDSDQRNDLSEKGMAWARNFTWEKKAEEYEAALSKAVDMFDKN
jgi:glycosyltransferase involved in cell wall biosynthesis